MAFSGGISPARFLPHFLLDMPIGVGMGRVREITDNIFAHSETPTSAARRWANKIVGIRLRILDDEAPD
jgi:hypothetical protein